MKDLNIVCKATEHYIKCANVTDYNDLKLMNTLTKIIIDNKANIGNFKYTKKYSLKEIDKIVNNFLLSLNPYYKEYYDLRKNDGSFIFDNDKNSYYNDAYSSYDSIDKKRIIYIPVTNTLNDAFCIVHELFHDINMDIKEESITRFFYTEGMSILGEMLLEDYLIENKVKDAIVPMNYVLWTTESKTIEVNFNINLLLTYIENNYIDIGKIFQILEEYSCNYIDDLDNTIRKIIDNEELTLDFEQPYILGFLIATYMYYRIKRNKNNIMELFELNQELKNYSFDQVLDYLELDYNDIDLNSNSYEKLKENYKRYIKRSR